MPHRTDSGERYVSRQARRHWLGVGGRCTCGGPRQRAENGPCPFCEAQAEMEEQYLEDPDGIDPARYEEGVQAAERAYEAHLDRINGERL